MGMGCRASVRTIGVEGDACASYTTSALLIKWLITKRGCCCCCEVQHECEQWFGETISLLPFMANMMLLSSTIRLTHRAVISCSNQQMFHNNSPHVPSSRRSSTLCCQFLNQVNNSLFWPSLNILVPPSHLENSPTFQR